jgi:hypothetical protein
VCIKLSLQQQGPLVVIGLRQDGVVHQPDQRNLLYNSLDDELSDAQSLPLWRVTPMRPG